MKPTDLRTEGEVKSATQDGVTTITFSHPAHNAMPGALLQALADAITAAGENGGNVILLKSGGDRTFCAGANFDELIAISDEASGKEFFMGFARVINACRKCPKLIVGRAQGKAVGGGVGIAASVDFCLATRYASVKLSELALGIGPFVVGPAVQRKIGLSAFSQLAVNATEWQTAGWAREQGLYAQVFETTGEMDAFLSLFTARLAKMSPEAMLSLKRIFWEGTGHWDDLLEERAAVSGKLVLSDFARKAIDAARQKS